MYQLSQNAVKALDKVPGDQSHYLVVFLPSILMVFYRMFHNNV